MSEYFHRQRARNRTDTERISGTSSIPIFIQTVAAHNIHGIDFKTEELYREAIQQRSREI